MRILIANSKSWFSVSKKLSAKCDIKSVSTKSELEIELVESLAPDFIFFPHWSWRVPTELFTKHRCILFHISPLPIGRGGSPIQNLILRGFTSAPLCALQMVDELDAGPIYLKREIDLSGSLAEIFDRMNQAANEMISQCLRDLPAPQPQLGKPEYFERLDRQSNELEDSLSFEEIYDRLRMVDHPDYPDAFIRFGNCEIAFSEIEKMDSGLVCKAVFSRL